MVKRQKIAQPVGSPVHIHLPDSAFTRDAVPAWLVIGLVVLVMCAALSTK